MKESIAFRIKIFAIIFLIFGIIFIGFGFNKMLVYDNGTEYSWTKMTQYKNAYVGGDAYNYIINGTYFGGYAALGGSMLICATVCEIGSLIIEIRIEDEKIYKSKLTEPHKSSLPKKSNLSAISDSPIFRDEEH